MSSYMNLTKTEIATRNQAISFACRFQARADVDCTDYEKVAEVFRVSFRQLLNILRAGRGLNPLPAPTTMDGVIEAQQDGTLALSGLEGDYVLAFYREHFATFDESFSVGA